MAKRMVSRKGKGGESYKEEESKSEKSKRKKGDTGKGNR